jgi:hypothetical protein
MEKLKDEYFSKYLSKNSVLGLQKGHRSLNRRKGNKNSERIIRH